MRACNYRPRSTLERMRRFLGGWSATPTLPGYGRIARDSGVIAKVSTPFKSPVRDGGNWGQLSAPTAYGAQTFHWPKSWRNHCRGSPAAELFFLFAGTLNLHKLPAETPFDAKIAVSDAVVKRRGHANDLAFLLVHG